MLIGRNGHNQGIKEKITIIQTCIFGSGNDFVHNLDAFFGCFGDTVRCDGQAENCGAIAFGQWQELFDAFRLIAHGVDEGAAGIGFESGFQGCGIAGINGQRHIGKLGDFGDGLGHSGSLVDTAYAHVDIKQMGTGFDLIDRFFFYAQKGAVTDFRSQFFAARGVDALTNQAGGHFSINADGFTAAGQPKSFGWRSALRQGQISYGFG